MSNTNRALLLVGSPRGKKSSSTLLGNYLLNDLKEKGVDTIDTIWLGPMMKSTDKIEEMKKNFDNSNIIILAAPLYDDCQPYIVIRWMEIISEYVKSKSLKTNEEDKKILFVIKNCAFPEEHHNLTVIKIYKRFAEWVGLKWGGSLSISAGEFLRGRYGKTLDDAGKVGKKVKIILENIADSLSKRESFEDKILHLIPPKLYRGIFTFVGVFFNWMNNKNWAKNAKKNKQDVNARPYSQ